MNLITRILLIVSLLFSGLLAGVDIDRALVTMPAWQQTATAWAEFSRHADLGNGLVLYPLEAVAGALLALATAVSFHFERVTPRAAAAPLYTAVVLAALGLVFTIKAAPIMLGIHSVSDAAVLQEALEGFWYWGNWRAVGQVLSFVALLVALFVSLRGVKAAP
jgi:hypothetical protein